MMDPTREEEQLEQGTLTVIVDVVEKKVMALEKQGIAALPWDALQACKQKAMKQAAAWASKLKQQ